MNNLKRIAMTAAVAVVAATLTSGCQTTQLPVEPPPGVTVSVFQPRPDIAKDRIAIKVRNDGAAPLSISAASLSSDFFAGEFVWGPGRTATVAAGSAIDLRADIPPVDSCDEDLSASSVRFDWRVGETSGTSVITPEDPFSILDVLHDRGCFIDAIRKVGSISAVSLTPPVQEPAPATLLISIVPTGEAGTVTIESIGSTTLLNPADPNGIGAAQLELGIEIDANGPFEIAVPIVPNRCDEHAISEDKIGTRMPLRMRLADGAEGRFVLPASDQLRAQMYGFYTDFCGL